MNHHTVAARSPLDVAVSIAERFMKIRFDHPDYMHRVGLIGILDLYEATGDEKYLDFYLAGKDVDKPWFDWRLFEATGDACWLAGAEQAGERYLADPRRDCDGAVLDPRGRYTVDCFSGQFTQPIIFGYLLQDQRYFDEAAKLLAIYRGYLEEPITGLWYSRWGHALHPNRPNPGLWSRGNGWLVAAWGRTMHLWDQSHAAYASTLEYWQQYCEAIAKFQVESGLFRQLLNRPDCFEESTGSGLFCTGFSHGVANGTLPPEFGGAAWKSFCGLRGLVDEDGNIHNSSTYAGGYNFERQYYSCARFNEPHGDGTVMSACVAMHCLLEQRPDMTQDIPAVEPIIVTVAQPGVLTTEPPVKRSGESIAEPVLQRILDLNAIPDNDPYGATIAGLLHWYDYRRDPRCLSHAARLLESSGDGLSDLTTWSLRTAVSIRSKVEDIAPQLQAFVDAAIERASRDRFGNFLDEHGGYSIEHLHQWLKLLAHAAAVTGRPEYSDEACRQLFGHQRWLEDPLTYFWYSAYGRGAHPRRVTPGLWALGNAYLLDAIVTLLEHLPREHPRYADVVFVLRRLLHVLHEYLPVGGGWRQILDDLNTFPCNAASGLITYGSAQAMLMRCIEPEYFAVVAGGVWHLGERVNVSGHYAYSSRPHGGLDTIAEYATHYVHDDASSLGYILSGLACGAHCMEAKINPDEIDHELGAR